MDVNSILNEFGKNIANDNILDKVYQLSDDYNIDLPKISNLLASYLLSKDIDDDKITLNTIESFEKEKLMGSQNINQKSIKSPTLKVLKRILIENDIFAQYQIDDDSNALTTCHSTPIDDLLNTKEESRIVYEVSDCEMDENNDPIHINQSWPVTISGYDDKYEYMYQLNTNILDVFKSNDLDVIRKRLEKRNGGLFDESNHVHMSDMSPVNKTGQEVHICGTIVIDNTHTPPTNKSDNDCTDRLSQQSLKLSTDNIAIQGFSSIQLAAVPLNLALSNSYSFFPGQNVILKGHNSSNTGFVISEVLPSYTNPCLPISVSSILGDLRVLIGSGPFSLKNTDDDSVLEKLMLTMTAEQCDLLVLIGPFVDYDNEAVQKRSEIDLFSTMQTEKLLMVAKSCIAHNVQVVFIPSVNDAGHDDNVLPQPKYDVPSDVKEFAHPSVHFAPNPGFFKVGPFSFGATSVDILRHMSLQEINKNHTKGIKRHCQNILRENNFYPLRPSNAEIIIDWTMWPKCAFGSHTPHCLIMPSKLNNFKEDVDGVCVVNPGYATTDHYHGTCAVLTLTEILIDDQSVTISPAVDCKFIRL